MSVKKALALLALLAILSFAALVIINTFWPNDVTTAIYTFITVTVPAYLSDKLEWVLGSIGAVVTVIGAASKKISDTKDTATKQVAVAEEQKNQAQQLATNQYGEVEKLTKEKVVLEERIKGMEANRTEAEKLVVQQQAEIKRLEQDLDKANEKLTSIPYREVTVTK